MRTAVVADSDLALVVRVATVFSALVVDMTPFPTSLSTNKQSTDLGDHTAPCQCRRSCRRRRRRRRCLSPPPMSHTIDLIESPLSYRTQLLLLLLDVLSTHTTDDDDVRHRGRWGLGERERKEEGLDKTANSKLYRAKPHPLIPGYPPLKEVLFEVLSFPTQRVFSALSHQSVVPTTTPTERVRHVCSTN